MFEEVLYKIKNVKWPKDTYLAGAAALALYEKHRETAGVDLFSPEKFKQNELVGKLSKFKEYKLSETNYGGVFGRFGDLDLNVYYSSSPLLDVTTEIDGFAVASLPDLAAMKTQDMAVRGSKRDFIDLYVLAGHFAIEKMIEFYGMKYGHLDEDWYKIVKAMGYFEEAEEDDFPIMRKRIDWEEIKRYFTSYSMRLAKKQLENSGQ